MGARKENLQPDKPVAETADQFPDISALRLSQQFLETAGAKKALMTVPVHKPRSQDFVRVHPDPAFREAFAVILLKDDGDERYLLMPDIAAAIPAETVVEMFYTTINRQKVVSLWPVAAAACGRSHERMESLGARSRRTRHGALDSGRLQQELGCL
jgi:hypothetical protein